MQGHLLDFAAERSLAVAENQGEDLHQLLCTLRDIGIQPRSQARMIAGIRAFFRFPQDGEKNRAGSVGTS